MDSTDICLTIVSIFHLGVSAKQGLESLLLTSRCVLCMWNHYYENPIYNNYLYCIGTMVLKDILEIFTETKYKEDPWLNNVMQFFMLGNMYTSYFPIITIQLSPYVPRDLYPELFNTNIITIVTTDYMFAPICYCACWYINDMKENKYFCWLIVFASYSLIQQAISNVQYVPEEFKWYPWYYMSAYFVFNLRNRMQS
jgi:hypothetical protein